MRPRAVVHRDTKPATEPRPVKRGDVVRDPHFPNKLSVVSHAADGWLYFSQGDNKIAVSCIALGGLVHADGAPIDTTELP